MKFKTITRVTIITFLVAAAMFYLVADRTSIAPTAAQNQDPLYFPILLVHGLGEGPGAETFGNLEQYLRDFYFDVEVMDFNDYNGKGFAKKEGGELGAAAAALGLKVKEIAEKYKVAKVNIVAHSFGGLVTQAYLLGMGGDFDKNAGYEDDVHKVVYIQTPFYGVKVDSKDLSDMVNVTDYGRFASDKVWQEILAYGSDEIFAMHNLLDADNIYEEEIDAISMFSEDDEVVEVSSASMSSFLGTRDNENFDRYRKFKNYSHNSDPVEPAANSKGSLAWVENFNDENFLTMVSFLDDGGLWRDLGSSDIEKLYTIMVQVDSNAGKLNGSEVSLELLKKFKVKGTRNPIKAGADVEPLFNKKSRVFFFKDLGPGEYMMTIKTSKQKEPVELEVELPAGRPYVDGYSYDANENVVSKGGTPVGGDVECIYYNPEVVIAGVRTVDVPLPNLNLEGFEVEFEISGVNVAAINKGVLVAMYNAKGSFSSFGGRNNGSRFTIQARGSAADNAVHANKIHVELCTERDFDGNLDDDEDYSPEDEFVEHKEGSYNWAGTNKIRVRVEYTPNATQKTRTTVFVNDQLAFIIWNWHKYYNPDPWFTVGNYFDHDEYRSPIGAVIRNLCVRNLK